MAYSLPELVLVGAAQNLVLETSGAVDKNVTCAPAPGDQDIGIGTDEYNQLATW